MAQSLFIVLLLYNIFSRRIYLILIRRLKTTLYMKMHKEVVVTNSESQKR